MIRTRVGYTGGRKEQPTYHDLGDHTESLQIDFDPARLTYADLLDVFWKTHNPCGHRWNRQYMSAVFCADAEQAQLALATRNCEAARLGNQITTELLPLEEFYLAEDYHQKYLLQHCLPLLTELAAVYPEMRDLVRSTAAARLNGFLGGYGTLETLEQEITSYGLSAEGQEVLRANVQRRR